MSVQITVVAPIVSQACILRTRVLPAVILRILYARLRVTLIGNPSGTATTIMVTDIIKKRRRISTFTSQGLSREIMPSTISLVVREMKSSTAIAMPTFPIREPSLPSSLSRGVLFPVMEAA